MNLLGDFMCVGGGGLVNEIVYIKMVSLTVSLYSQYVMRCFGKVSSNH